MKRAPAFLLFPALAWALFPADQRLLIGTAGVTLLNMTLVTLS